MGREEGWHRLQVARVDLDQEYMTVWGQGLLSFSSGWAGSCPVWRNLWQCLDWGRGEAGGAAGLVAPLLALKPLGLGRGAAVTLPKGCAAGGVCFRVLTCLAVP